MIAAVTAALAEFGVLRPGTKPRLQIGLTRGDTLWIDAFIDRQRYVHVKVSDVISLREEARTYTEASALFGDFVPRALGYCRRDGWEIFVTEGVEHRQFFSDDLLTSRHTETAIEGICRFFERSRRDPNTSPRLQNGTAAALVESLEAQFKDSPFAPILPPWCSDSGRRELEALGSIRQHCDLVPNNMGIGRAGLVIFDWEDFGKISLPGLDLFTLVLSCLEGDVEGLSGNGAGVLVERCSPFVRPACGALDMDVSLFWRLMPLYLLAFLYLKSAYATEVRARIGALLLQLVSNRPH